MRKINCIIADDEELARNVVKNHVSRLAQLNVAAICSNGVEVYHAIRETGADLIFLDIQMPELTGIELLRTLTNPPAIIITTAYSEFAVEGYELNVIDYLLKPISFERFLKAIHKYETGLHLRHAIDLEPSVTINSMEPEPFIYVKADKKMVKIILKDILYLEGMKDYVKIKTSDQQVITYQTLTYFEEKLPDKWFLRVHRSFIISLQHISSFSSSELKIGDAAVPIGRTYVKDVSKKIRLLPG